MMKALFSLLLILFLSTSCSLFDRKYEGHYKIGDPYVVEDKWYVPEPNDSYVEIGTASWYGPGFHGKKTANGTVYNQKDLTAAHRTLPLPSKVRVTNLENGNSIVVTVSDRGPFSKSRIIDVSEEVAKKLDFKLKGTARVQVEFLKEETETHLAELKLSPQKQKAMARHDRRKETKEFAIAKQKQDEHLRLARQRGEIVTLAKLNEELEKPHQEAVPVEEVTIAEVEKIQEAEIMPAQITPKEVKIAEANIPELKKVITPKLATQKNKPVKLASSKTIPHKAKMKLVEAKPTIHSTTGHESYIVQVATFKDKAKADSFKSQIGSVGHAIIQKDAKLGIYRVCLGPTTDHKQAEKLQKKLQDSGKGPGVILAHSI